jgi:hypothetical protein
MREVAQITDQFAAMSKRRDVLAEYLRECLRTDDLHGVQDAASDLREVDAAMAALDWALGKRETLGY